MWPSALQLTRDECRGILRRLELESYSNVISVFRAQGGLSDSKAKLLEDLRNIFHISQERHRAEARRVANDEQLSTIAEAISGPNTWQEWSREGRRTYPLLPRVPPQTALSIIANNVATEVTNENSKLPYPSETGAAQKQQQDSMLPTERTRDSVPVVTSDPLQPDYPEIRKNLKRNLPSETLASTKKRIVSDISPSATANDSPLSPGTQIRKLYHNHSKTQSKQKNVLGKKLNNSPSKRPTAAAKKRLISRDSIDSNKTNNVVTTVYHATSNSQSVPASAHHGSAGNEAAALSMPHPSASSSQEIVMDTPEKIILIPTAAAAVSSATTITSPQIATSKKDISKNLSKLNMLTNQQPLLQQHQEKLSECKTEKLSTPVQKYIVEERAPMLVSNSSTLPTHLLDKQQIVASKVKPMTTIVPNPLASSKAKITSVKTLKSADIVCSSPVSSQPQVFNVIDPSAPPFVPHTPPAIINISSKFEPEHGKVLTTKLLPLMLSSSSSKLDSSNGGAGHLKNLTSHGSPSTATVFRKPNIIKSSAPIKQKIQITSQQIISPPAVTNLKMSPHLHLKGVPGGGPIHNRKSVKIFSSPNGKMFIQPADSASKQMTKLNTIVAGQKASGHIVNAGPAPGRIAIQKVQIIPAPTTTPSGGVVSKPIAISKPNMIFMPMTSAPTVKGLSPLVKSNKFTTVLPTSIGQETTATTTTTAKSNVFVIGAVQSPPQTILPKDMQSFNNRSNMITEDTPVDIITTPIIVDVDSIDNSSAKPTETIDLTSIGETSASSSSRVITATGSTLQSRMSSDTCFLETVSKDAGGNSDEPTTAAAANESRSTHGNTVAMTMIGVTDWEMELEKEASKTRALNAQRSQKHGNVESMLVGSGGEGDEDADGDGDSSDDHFVDDDVIEEQEETEDETDDGCDTADDSATENKRQHHSQDSRHQQMDHRHHHHHNDDEEEETIEVGDEHIKSDGDVIQYDESYESANDDMDDNIAIEYVEEEQDGYEEKIDSTSNDRKETMECNSNIVLIKQSTDPLASSENKSLSPNDCMVSVEEISSTTQQNLADSQDEH